MDTVDVAIVMFWSEIPIGASFDVFNMSSKRIVTLITEHMITTYNYTSIL